MSSKFVEFTESNAKNTPLFLRPEDVATVAVCGGETIISCSEKQFYYVTASPAEVVAKLQQPAPPAESEAVQLLERYLRWGDQIDSVRYKPSEIGSESVYALRDATRALLAKLKGGK